VILIMRSRLTVLSSLLLLTACGGGGGLNGSDEHAHMHAEGNVSGIAEGVWPPQPLGMQNEERLSAELRTRARLSVVDAARSAVLNNPAVLAAIGSNYGSFDATLSESKNGNVASFVFYNYDTDQTVEAVLSVGGAVNVQVQPASVWQPTENGDEVAKAVNLARTSLTADGHSIDTLQGTAMLTYPAATEPEMEAPVFYDTRILYVTFGQGDGVPPLFSARVNIATEVVSEGGPLR